MKKKGKAKSDSKQEENARPFTRTDFHNLLKRAITPPAPKPAHKSA
jgi:hypothetical protein